MDDDPSLPALADAVALWHAWPGWGTGEIVSAAVDALVAGHDSPTLRELAGQWNHEDWWTMRPLVDDTLSELGLPPLAETTSETELAAARVLSRRLLAGTIGPQDLSGWVNAAVGYDGAPELRKLVEIHDSYDVVDLLEESEEDLDEAVRQEARSLLGTGG